MAGRIDLVGIVTPKPGHTERFIDLFTKCAEYAEKNEPGTLTYRYHRGDKAKNDGLEELVIRETYENQAALDKHMTSPPVQVIMKELEAGTLVDKVKVIHITPGGGVQRAKI
ncbi:hypothetical protein SODALDRAFT_290206 [Sodiomyces alkalinus F11]|uniref:ABM domain-containing protein n=1 Tax=Sodiomyces alkalinus (strain CBS 110278 / VKM F-3762 / F11) TaxID=1314773 RepID=A0A3N2Q091_SODAK|nr:hypothetical protein SODALDRAFT_290206 [Sodiomyces alkalinus F11]ROT40189.1 hypothetical protein SODALDRAFT_290206 [Sodiomyces alkalinus F11]